MSDHLRCYQVLYRHSEYGSTQTAFITCQNKTQAERIIRKARRPFTTYKVKVFYIEDIGGRF